MHTTCIKTQRCGCGAQPTISMGTGVKKNACICRVWAKPFDQQTFKVWNIHGCSYFGIIGLILNPDSSSSFYCCTNIPHTVQIMSFSSLFLNSLIPTLCCIPFNDLLLLLLLVDRLKKKKKKTLNQNSMKSTQGSGHIHPLIWMNWKCCVYSHES